MNIISLLNQIDSKDIVLPAIQRDFVWEEDKIQKLMDSILRGYPIGIALMWETYEDLQYRYFARDYVEDNKTTFYDNSKKRKLKIVLDGQQRLQSLYIALYGKYKGKYLYFDILSGKESDDFKEESYLFNFATNEEASQWNKEIIGTRKNKSESNDLEYYVSVNELFSLSASEKLKFRKEISKKLNLSEDDEIRLEINLAKLDEVLVKEQNILKTSVIDENKPNNSKERKSESDILEIFVRVNRQGTPLSRSDLIFSMLKLNWKESASALPDFVKDINVGNSFDLDMDFIIRCLFAVSDLGTKFDIDLLRKKRTIEKIKKNYQKCCEAIRSTVDTVQRDCWCSSSKALGGYHTLVPFVYYLFHAPKHQVPNSEISNVRKALYLFGFTTPFSRYADSRLGKFIKDELKPLADNKDYSFPYLEAVSWVNYWEGISAYGPELLQKNPRLTHYVVQQYAGAKTHYQANLPEMDHIFPRSKLRNKDYDEAQINHFANFWILSKGKNQNKSNIHPKKYFDSVNDSELKKAFIDRTMLDYRYYRRFIRHRREKVMNYVKKKIGFLDEDFNINDSE